MCTAEKPFRAAGTGLGKESLSTKLVPGKIAGSMHSTLAPREVAITASAQAQDLPSISSLDINKQVGCSPSADQQAPHQHAHQHTPHGVRHLMATAL